MLGKNIFRGDLNMFLPKAVYYEKESENYGLGKELLKRYRDKGRRWWPLYHSLI